MLSRSMDLEQTRKIYQKVAWFYDFWSWLTESKAINKVIDLADIRNGEKILEVACGTGVALEEILRANPEGENIGIDLSPHMLAKAKKRLSKYNQHHLTLQEVNIFDMDIDSQQFDLIINNFMIDLIPAEKFDEIIQIFFNLLKPGGRLVISTFAFGTKRVNKVWPWVAEHFPSLLTGCRPVKIQPCLTEAGFRIQQSVEVSQNTFPSEVILANKAE